MFIFRMSSWNMHPSAESQMLRTKRSQSCLRSPDSQYNKLIRVKGFVKDQSSRHFMGQIAASCHSSNVISWNTDAGLVCINFRLHRPSTKPSTLIKLCCSKLDFSQNTKKLLWFIIAQVESMKRRTPDVKSGEDDQTKFVLVLKNNLIFE